MPRPKGWKPLSYTRIAEICGRLVLGARSNAVAAEFGVYPVTVRHLKKTLLKMGASPKLGATGRLAPDIDATIGDLVRTTRLTNHEIARQCSLSSTWAVRSRRKAYHAELRMKGEPVPVCQCGEEFQHARRCRFMGCGPRPVNKADLPHAVAELVAGVHLADVQKRFECGTLAANALLKGLSRAQRKKRHQNVVLRARASKRRKELAPEVIFGRIKAGVPSSLPTEVRDEVIQVMAVDVLEGLLTIDDALGRVRSYTSKAYRSLGDWRNVSIDAERDGLSLGDLLEDESAMEAFAEMDEMELA